MHGDWLPTFHLILGFATRDVAAPRDLEPKTGGDVLRMSQC